MGFGARDPHRLLARFQISIPVSRIVSISARVWPTLELRWRERGQLHRRVFGAPWSPSESWTPTAAHFATERTVESLVTLAEDEGWPGLRRGWWDEPSVHWEPATTFPSSNPNYRVPADSVIAEGRGLRGWRRFWLDMRHHARKSAPESVMVTPSLVYAQFDGQVFRMPRSFLRQRYEIGRFRLYRFGRRTTLVLDRTSVATTALDDQLSRRAATRRRRSA